jgi:hypothetical protein
MCRLQIAAPANGPGIGNECENNVSSDEDNHTPDQQDTVADFVECMSKE